jgi:cation:H+ antiporter
MPLAAASGYPLWLNLLLFLAAAALVWVAGTRLAVYVDALAARWELGQAAAGMLLMGVITSMPEIANATTASLIGNPALAVNNLLGSAAINVLLLAVGDALIGRGALTAMVASAGTLMQGTLCMLVLGLVAAAILVGDVAVLGVGLWALALCALCVAAFWLAAGYARRSRWTVAAAEGATGSAAEGGPRSAEVAAPLAKTILAAAIILVAGYALSQTGDALAEQTGLGSGLVGFVLLGFATSLPELSSIASALRIRRAEMAIGEILGTNFINVALILLADAVYAGGPVINALGRFEAVSALLGATLVGIYLVGLLERRDPVVLRMGYDSLAVMAVFAGGLALLFSLRGAPS